MFCKKCGGKIESYASHCPFCGEPVESNNVQATYTTPTTAPVEENQKSVLAWIGIYIVSAIPIIGFILLFIWAFGNETKNNLTFRNWAKAQIIIYIVTFVLILLLYGSLILKILNDY